MNFILALHVGIPLELEPYSTSRPKFKPFTVNLPVYPVCDNNYKLLGHYADY